jgi:hypothetical protein
MDSDESDRNGFFAGREALLGRAESGGAHTCRCAPLDR